MSPTNVAIGFHDEPAAGDCSSCGAAMGSSAGPRLVLGAEGKPLCLKCGHTLAPELAALLHVAQLAEQVGRVTHHNRSWPVMDGLLKLASASELYYLLLVRRERAA